MELKSTFTYKVKEGKKIENTYFLETKRTLTNETIKKFVKGSDKPTIYNVELVEGIVYSCLSYKMIIKTLIREKYDIDDELSIHRQRDTKPEEFAEYNEYVEACKLQAKAFIAERDKVLALNK